MKYNNLTNLSGDPIWVITKKLETVIGGYYDDGIQFKICHYKDGVISIDSSDYAGIEEVKEEVNGFLSSLPPHEHRAPNDLTSCE